MFDLRILVFSIWLFCWWQRKIVCDRNDIIIKLEIHIPDLMWAISQILYPYLHILTNHFNYFFFSHKIALPHCLNLNHFTFDSVEYQCVESQPNNNNNSRTLTLINKRMDLQLAISSTDQINFSVSNDRSQWNYKKEKLVMY